MPLQWLHGLLMVEVIEGESLPQHALIYSREKNNNFCEAILTGCEGLICGLKRSATYVTVEIGPTRRARTTVLKERNPMWKEKFAIPVADQVEFIAFTIKDDHLFGAPHIGRVEIPVEQVVGGQPVRGVFALKDEGGKEMEDAKLRIFLQFKPVNEDPSYGQGLKGELSKGGDGAIKDVYFPLRKGCKVRLYNDAHQEPGQVVRGVLAGGADYEVHSYFRDVYDAILQAEHLIYITGWSVWTELKLVRDPTKADDQGSSPTLGELLKSKADQGVRVCIMVWDDKTSLNNPLIKTSGMMATHDEETWRYFLGSGVHCKKVPRNGGHLDSLKQRVETGNMFTHHQKTVIVDAAPVHEHGAAPEQQQKRRLICFLGGVDLCDGRYDTKEHSLFKTLTTVHSDDFHQACVKGFTTKAGGPREPWHDIHSRLEGSIAWDAWLNFVQRWREQAGLKRQRQLLDMRKVSQIYVPDESRNALQSGRQTDPRAMVRQPHGQHGAWSAQLFRSITSESVAGLPRNTQHAYEQGLSSGKGKIIDFSIQIAYVQAIRRSHSFLYIENQYFLGSAHAWLDSKGAGGANHLVPIEIALKIAGKIRMGQHYCVYVVLPMWPEGVPDTLSVQEVLFWQYQTMRMMYAIIAAAMAEAGVQDRHPTDYLSFFCPGNREPPFPGEHKFELQPANGSEQSGLQEKRRFMIYVHSKMIIADDEFIIVGSANINQRSMDGSRDTEIAMGSFQPEHVADAQTGTFPKGQIHGFRLNLLEEHLGMVVPEFSRPNSVECMRLVRRLAEANWEAFAAPEVQPLPHGHLMTYPIQVSQDGTVGPLPGHDTFPDFPTAKVIGANSGTLPDLLTT